MWIKKKELEKLENRIEYYEDLTGTLIVEIKERSTENKELKEKIKRLEAQIENNTSNQHE